MGSKNSTRRFHKSFKALPCSCFTKHKNGKLPEDQELPAVEKDREEMDKGCGWPCQNLEFYVHQCIIFITIIKIVKMLSLCRKASSTGWKIEWSIPLQCAMLSGVGTSSCSSDSASTSACTMAELVTVVDLVTVVLFRASGTVLR